MSSLLKKEILVGIVGVGLVGSELIAQILSIPAGRNPFKIVFIASSKRVLYAPVTSADPAVWKAQLAEQGEEGPVDPRAFAGYLRSLAVVGGEDGKKRGMVIVDNTSSEEVAGMYARWVREGVSVVTPNKKAFSGSRKVWEGIVEAGLGGEAPGRWLNEATVGAGLPVINTLKEMVGTGDRIRKIEGVFSGTMSYIFNEWSSAAAGAEPLAFSSVVKGAREKGYTEPHPADDLNGFDVARKLTILARTVGAFSLEETKVPVLESFLDVQTQSLIPAALEGVKSGDVFVERLKEHDAEFEKLRAEAEREGQVLRFVGVVDVENGVVKAGLEKCVSLSIILSSPFFFFCEVGRVADGLSFFFFLLRYPVTHPFATSLGGSDNIIMFHSERYSPRPLIVQGSGAGAAVTAMGVLGDLLKLV